MCQWSVIFLAARISQFHLFTAVQIYKFHISKIIIHYFIWTQHIDQLPIGLLAQLVERCTGIAEVMGSNPVRA